MMPHKGNSITKEMPKNLSGTFPVSLELEPNAGDRKESSIPFSKESFKQVGAIHPSRSY